MEVGNKELEIERAFVCYILPIIITLAAFFNLSAINLTFKVIYHIRFYTIYCIRFILLLDMIKAIMLITKLLIQAQRTPNNLTLRTLIVIELLRVIFALPIDSGRAHWEEFNKNIFCRTGCFIHTALGKFRSNYELRKVSYTNTRRSLKMIIFANV